MCAAYTSRPLDNNSKPPDRRKSHAELSPCSGCYSTDASFLKCTREVPPCELPFKSFTWHQLFSSSIAVNNKNHNSTNFPTTNSASKIIPHTHTSLEVGSHTTPQPSPLVQNRRTFISFVWPTRILSPRTADIPRTQTGACPRR